MFVNSIIKTKRFKHSLNKKISTCGLVSGGGGGGMLPYIHLATCIWVCADGKGMVFKPFSLV